MNARVPVAVGPQDAASAYDTVARLSNEVAGRLARHRQEFVAAIKALATGPGNWPHLGYQLLPEH